MPLHTINEDELRSICKKKAESLEYWLRRIIHEKFTHKYGDDYFTKKLDNGESIIKSEVSRKSRSLRDAQPERYARDIDATLLDDLIKIVCKNKNYNSLFEEAFNKVSPLGNEHLRHILTKIWESRNPLSHANPISVRQAEQLICYSNDIVDSLKEYYKGQGISNLYNVPLILKMVDSFGNTIYREQMTKSPNDSVIIDLSSDSRYFLRPNDTYSIELEVDPNFEDSNYEIIWLVSGVAEEEKSNRLTITFENKHVSSVLGIRCRIKTYNDWHKLSNGVDDELSLLIKVLPPNL